MSSSGLAPQERGGEDARSSPDREAPALLSVRGIVKRFGAATALSGIDLDVRGGEIHALLGQNGAGKSTLVKVVSGVHQPDEGTLSVDGVPMAFADPNEARNAGIAVVYQELSLIPTLSVAANIFLGREITKRGLIDSRAMQAEAERLCEELGLDIPGAHVDVERLPFAQRQLVEIVKALSVDARIFILDEPTSSLAPGEQEALFAAIRMLRDRGAAVIYISHRLKEVFDLSDRVTVIRDAEVVAQYETAETDMNSLVAAITGTKQRNDRGHLLPGNETPWGRSSDAPVLVARGLRNIKLRGADLEVYPGEIVGIAGLRGSGRSSLLRALFGIDGLDEGEIIVDGLPLRLRAPKDAMEAGLALVPEDRATEGLILAQGLSANISLTQLDDLSSAGIVNRGNIRVRAREAVDQLLIKAPSTTAPMTTVSGGNQQKVVFAKWMQTGPKVFLADEPMAGVDVGAKAELAAVMQRLATNGAGVVVVSGEFDDLLDLCDRIVVFSGGRNVQEVDPSAVESENELHTIVQNTEIHNLVLDRE